MDHIIIPQDRTARIELKNGHLIVWFDHVRNQVIIQSDAKGTLLIQPRASNSIALLVQRL